MKQVVFAEPDNKAAKALLADTYEQMGYQAESGPWRSIYLQGAYELRNGVPSAGGTVTASADTIEPMSPELLFNYLGVRLNGEKASGKKIVLNLEFTDIKKSYGLTVENGTLRYEPELAAQADAKATLSKETLNAIQLKKLSVDDAVKSGAVKVDGRPGAFKEVLALMDDFPFWFNIVTP